MLHITFWVTILAFGINIYIFTSMMFVLIFNVEGYCVSLPLIFSLQVVSFFCPGFLALILQKLA